MEELIDYPEAFSALSSYLNDKFVNTHIERNGYALSSGREKFFIPMNKDLWPIGYTSKIKSFVSKLEEKQSLNNLIYGKNSLENIVSCECKDGITTLFFEENGIISTKTMNQCYYILSPIKYNDQWKHLEGNLHYKYIKYYDSLSAFYKDKKIYYGKDIYCINDPKESAMVLNGFTYFKGMKVSDVSVLSFDIESSGILHNEYSKVFMISNTFRRNGIITKKLFSLDSFPNEKDMLESWCAWIREVNPSVICGHNIFGYDLPYLNFCAEKSGIDLLLGRDGSKLYFNNYSSKFRKDGSQDYNYNRAFIFGREIVDTMFVAYHFDFARKYESYGLKAIIKHEGLEKPGRQFYNAAHIAQDWNSFELREKIKRYGEDDADDALALYDLMIPAYFYWTTYVPKSFQTINYSATGAQLNSFLVRGYLQHGHSIPKADESVKFKGAISDGFPGIYKNVFKIDVASLYPSIMLQNNIYDIKKDPKGYFIKMVDYFTKQRLEDKKKAKETGERYYQELEQSRKIAINSAYGLLGSSGLLFNSPKNASLVTEQGRNILKKAILWSTGNEYIEKEDPIEIQEG